MIHLSLQLLKDLKPPQDLELEVRDIGKMDKSLRMVTRWEQIREKLKHKWEIVDEEGNVVKDKEKVKKYDVTYIDRTAEYLKSNPFTVLKLVNESLLSLTIDRKLGNKDIVTYQNYSVYLNYKIVYKKCNLVAIQQLYGILTFNPNEEMHLKPVLFKTDTYHFIYKHEEGQWFEIPDKEFKKAKEVVEAAEASDEVLNILMEYPNLQRNMKNNLDALVFGKSKDRFKRSVEYLDSLLYYTIKFHEIQNCLSIINDEHFQAINKDIQNIKKLINDYKAKLNTVESDENQDANKASLLNVLALRLLKKFQREPGYHFRNRVAYPNLAQIYRLSQQATESRTQRSKQKLEEALIAFNKKYPNTLQVDLNDTMFVENFLKLKK